MGSNKEINRIRDSDIIRSEISATKRKGFFKDVINSIQDGISILDKDLYILFINAAMKKWYSHKLPLVGKKCYDAYHSRTQPCEICPSIRTLKTGKQNIDIVPLTGKEGIKGWLQLFTFPLVNSETDQLIGVIEYVRDISDLKHAEDAVKESEERFRALAKTAIDGIILADSDGIITFWNKGAQTMFGYTEEEVSGKQISILMPERYRNAHQNIIERILSSARSDSHYREKTFELYGLKKDGDEFPVELSVATWNTEKRTFYTAIVRDVTDRKRMEDELRALTLVDELTGLYNRRGFFTLAQQQLKIADRLQRGLFLIFADVDGLKNINDTFGHHEGNIALIDTAYVLKETFRESDIIARIGGDEFVIMAMETTDTDPDVFNDRLQDYVTSYNAKGNRRYKLSISIGIAGYNPYSPCTLDELIKKADALMYDQKRNKKRFP
jgi:diguanylate cyclase (GGDEF)-like protein/PAS domain S-box-containing protein